MIFQIEIFFWNLETPFQQVLAKKISDLFLHDVKIGVLMQSVKKFLLFS